MHRYYAFLIAAMLVATSAQAQIPTAGDVSSLRQSMQADPVFQLATRTARAEAQLDEIWYHGWSEDANQWQQEGKTIWVYNGAVRTEKWTYSTTEGGGLRNESRTLYTYDGSQRLATVTEQAWDAGSENFLPVSRDRHFYDGGATIATEVYYDEWDSEANSFVFASRETYTVASVGGQEYLTGGTSYEWDGSEWQGIERFTLEEEGEDVVYTSQMWNGAAWENSERSMYLGLTLEELYAEFERLMRDLEELEAAFLALRLPDAVHQTWDGQAWVNESRQVTASYYDLFTGIIIQTETESQVWEASDWVTDGRVRVSYEITGTSSSRPDSLFMEFPGEEGGWFTFIQEVYEYNAQGNLEDVYQDTAWLGELEPTAWILLRWSDAGTSVEDPPIVAKFALDPAYPNPFNPTTTLTFRAATAGDVEIHVYDMLGRRVATLASGLHGAGEHRVTFEADNLPSGTYLVRMEAPGVSETRSVTLLK